MHNMHMHMHMHMLCDHVDSERMPLYRSRSVCSLAASVLAEVACLWGARAGGAYASPSICSEAQVRRHQQHVAILLLSSSL